MRRRRRPVRRPKSAMAVFFLSSHRLYYKMPKPPIGTRYARLEVIGPPERTDRRAYAHVRVRCDCGIEKDVCIYSMRDGLVKSCGCAHRARLAAGRVIHGSASRDNKETEWIIWTSMRSRCNCPTNHAYKDYGGRGIKVCQRWDEAFQPFLEDMGRRPSPQHSLDRIDNDSGYSPENCRWATKTEQANNRRWNTRYTIGDRTLTISEWAREHGLAPNRVGSRLERGWPIEAALGLLQSAQRYEYDGKSMTLPEWATEVGLKYFTLFRRLGLGWSFEDAITLPLRTRPFAPVNAPRYEWAGKALTITEWSAETGLPRTCLVQRFQVLKWSPEKSLTTPRHNKGRPRREK